MQILSLFTGAMGLDIGLENHGFKTVISVENNKDAQSTIKTNRPDMKIFDDVFSVSKDDLMSYGNIDIIIGGPPCQSWSFAGNRKGIEDHRGLCIPRFLDIVDMILPKYVIMENVIGLNSALVNGVKGAMPPYIENRLKQSGYNCSYHMVNSADYGAPQCRKRIIFLASLQADLRLIQTHSNETQYDIFDIAPILPKWITLREVISDLQNSYGECANYSPHHMKFLSMLKEGQDWRDLPREYQTEAMKGAIDSEGGRTSYFRRLSWDKPSPTLMCCPTQNSTCLCHPDQTRPLSVKEYARIQGFPDNWIFQGNLASKYKQIGNAVPIKLAEAIGKTIKTAVDMV